MEALTKVSISKKFERQILRLPQHIQEKALAWAKLVENCGLREVSRRPGYHDEPLLGARWGQRSVRLNRSYRLIYQVIQDAVHIELIEVHKHDY